MDYYFFEKSTFPKNFFNPKSAEKKRRRRNKERKR